MKIYFPFALFLLASILCLSQTTNNLQLPTSINPDGMPPDASAVLDVQSTAQGMLLPRMTSIQRDAIPSPVAGLLIYNSNDSCFNYYTGSIWLKDCGRDLTADVGTAVALTSGGSSIDFGSDIAIDAEGNILVTGSFHGMVTFGSTTLISEGLSDVFTIKYDHGGNLLWATSGGGTSLDFGNGIATDADGNVFVTGDFQGTATFGPATLTSAGSTDLFTLKYDADGNLLWAASGGGASPDGGQDLATDAGGNVYVAGYFQSTAIFDTTALTSAGGRDKLTLKYDADGNLLWATSGGGTSHDVGRAIASDTDGNVFVTGSFFGSATFDSTTLTGMGGFEVFTVKYDTNGNLLWAKSGGGISGDDSYGIATDMDGNVLITGSFNGMATFDTTTLTSTGGIEVFTVKYDASGNLIWAISGGGASNDVSSGIATDADGNVFVTGSFQATATFDSITLTSAGARDVFILKYDTGGSLLWAASGGGTSDDFGNGIATDADGNAFVTGYFVGATATFGPITLTGAGGAEMYVVQYNASGGQHLPATNLSASQDNDPDPTNELIISVTLNGDSLEITDAGGTKTVDLSHLNPVETDPEVGINTFNYLPKWDGSSLVQSASVYEDVSGNVGIGDTNPSEKLTVSGNIKAFGDICATGIIGACSDRRYKRDFQPLTGALSSVMAINGLYYHWKTEDFPDQHFNTGRQLGLIAQEVELLFPEVVMTNSNGYKAIDYGRLTPVLIEAVKEQQVEIEKLKEANKEFAALKQEVDQLKKMIEGANADLIDNRNTLSKGIPKTE